jgi:hypothetical protein
MVTAIGRYDFIDSVQIQNNSNGFYKTLNLETHKNKNKNKIKQNQIMFHGCTYELEWIRVKRPSKNKPMEGNVMDSVLVLGHQ